MKKGFFFKQLFDLKESFLDLIFPSDVYCIVCNKPIYNQPYSICETCRSELSWITGKRCSKCGKALSNWYFPEICADCTQTPHQFTKGFSCVEYDEKARQIIVNFKYNGRAYFAKHIAEIMYNRLKELYLTIDYIIPVPLHPKREKERGYNQSQLVAKHLSRISEIEMKDQILIRSRYTKDQNKLTLQERKKNLKDAFRIDKKGYLLNKNILLIDDVYTTGNTVDACCKVINKQGAKNIYIFTFAIGKNV